MSVHEVVGQIRNLFVQLQQSASDPAIVQQATEVFRQKVGLLRQTFPILAKDPTGRILQPVCELERMWDTVATECVNPSIEMVAKEALFKKQQEMVDRSLPELERFPDIWMVRNVLLGKFESDEDFAFAIDMLLEHVSTLKDPIAKIVHWSITEKGFEKCLERRQFKLAFKLLNQMEIVLTHTLERFFAEVAKTDVEFAMDLLGQLEKQNWTLNRTASSYGIAETAHRSIVEALPGRLEELEKRFSALSSPSHAAIALAKGYIKEGNLESAYRQLNAITNAQERSTILINILLAYLERGQIAQVIQCIQNMQTAADMTVPIRQVVERLYYAEQLKRDIEAFHGKKLTVETQEAMIKAYRKQREEESGPRSFYVAPYELLPHILKCDLLQIAYDLIVQSNNFEISIDLIDLLAQSGRRLSAVQVIFQVAQNIAKTRELGEQERVRHVLNDRVVERLFLYATPENVVNFAVLLSEITYFSLGEYPLFAEIWMWLIQHHPDPGALYKAVTVPKKFLLRFDLDQICVAYFPRTLQKKTLQEARALLKFAKQFLSLKDRYDMLKNGMQVCFHHALFPRKQSPSLLWDFANLVVQECREHRGFPRPLCDRLAGLCLMHNPAHAKGPELRKHIRNLWKEAFRMLEGRRRPKGNIMSAVDLLNSARDREVIGRMPPSQFYRLAHVLQDLFYKQRPLKHHIEGFIERRNQATTQYIELVCIAVKRGALPQFLMLSKDECTEQGVRDRLAKKREWRKVPSYDQKDLGRSNKDRSQTDLLPRIPNGMFRISSIASMQWNEIHKITLSSIEEVDQFVVALAKVTELFPWKYLKDGCRERAWLVVDMLKLAGLRSDHVHIQMAHVPSKHKDEHRIKHIANYKFHMAAAITLSNGTRYIIDPALSSDKALSPLDWLEKQTTGPLSSDDVVDMGFIEEDAVAEKTVYSKWDRKNQCLLFAHASHLFMDEDDFDPSVYKTPPAPDVIKFHVPAKRSLHHAMSPEDPGELPAASDCTREAIGANVVLAPLTEEVLQKGLDRMRVYRQDLEKEDTHYFLVRAQDRTIEF